MGLAIAVIISFVKLYIVLNVLLFALAIGIILAGAAFQCAVDAIEWLNMKLAGIGHAQK